MPHAKPLILNTYAFLPDAGLLLISVISLAYLLTATGCAQNTKNAVVPVENSAKNSASAVDINTAEVRELERLPGVGAQTARRIVEHREKYGRFRRPEHLILVHGMSDRKFRRIAAFVKAE